MPVLCFPARIALLLCALAMPALAAPITAPVSISSNYLRVELQPGRGGAVEGLALIRTGTNQAGPGGLLNEGFGVGSFYIPNRRLNERLEVVERIPTIPTIDYRYDCEGPNISGLSVERRFQLDPNEASLSVRWSIENKGDERQWVAPWVRNVLRPGGSLGEGDRIDVPSIDGIRQPKVSGYDVLARNWAAATDPATGETTYVVFHAEHVHSMLTAYSDDACALHAALVPRVIEPGARFETHYRLSCVSGLQHVDFASDELAAQIDVADSELTVLLSATKPMPGLELEPRVVGPDGTVWTLARKAFDLDPSRLARCTFDWEAPAPGTYEFLGQVFRGDTPLFLGEETGSPHGGIDTQFRVGESYARFEPWTDAPFALAYGARDVDAEGVPLEKAQVWLQSGVEKVLRQDVPARRTASVPQIELALARGEFEHAQIVVRPTTALRLDARSTLLQSESGATLPAPEVRRVHFHDVHVPSHFEGATGQYPDALSDRFPVVADAGRATPLWITVRAPRDAEAGIYDGSVEVMDSGELVCLVPIRVRVFDFALPVQPRLATSFGYIEDAALDGARAQGGNASADALRAAYLENALAHRVTLRESVQLPRESANYADALAAFESRAASLLQQGATSVSVPPSLGTVPERLREANAFVRNAAFAERAYVQLADDPAPPAWDRVLETMQAWKDAAPDVPILITTLGLRPFLPDTLDIWGVHTQLFDTTHQDRIVERIRSGAPVWAFVNHAPPRPYANFFVDFAGTEHRVLFWQLWALGIEGLSYWAINYSEAGQDPWESCLDITPVNGDGMLVYPGPEGPYDSIRWEIIRDGIDDYDYLSLFREYVRRAQEQGIDAGLIERAAAVQDLGSVFTSLVSFDRDAAAMLRKRIQLGETIEALAKALD